MSLSSENTTSSIVPIEEFSFPVPQSRIIVFGFLIVLLIPSLLCSIYLFYQFIRRRDIRNRQTNLFIICLIIVNFIQASGELPLTLIFLYLNRAAVMSPIFCQWWCFLSASLYGIGLWTMAIGSIERHLFIFNAAILKKYKITLHYIPLICCFVLPVVLYIFLAFLFPCTNNFVYAIFWCGAPCYMNIPFWQVFSWLLDHGIPMCILVIANIILTVRIMCHKRRMKQTNLWSKNARMFFQLISVASLYAVCWLPFLVSGQVNTYTLYQSPVASMLFLEYFCYLPYITVTLCPFVCLFGLWRDLHDNRGLIAVVFHRHGARVEPAVSLRTVATTRANI